MTELLQRELLIVAGKGGVGKTAVTAALGLLAVERGRRAAMVEMSGAASLGRYFDLEEVGYGGREVRPGLHAFSISAPEAVREYLMRHIRFERLYDLVFGNRFIAPFMSGVLGLSDLISLGKVMDLGWEVDDEGERRYDLLLLDAPATGHGLTMLRSARAMMDAARQGPLYNNARLVDELLSDPERAALVLVTLPEEMPVNETIQMARQVADEGLVRLAAVVVNGVPLLPLDPPEREAFSRFVDGPGARAGGQVGRALREVERLQAARRRAQREIDRLRAAVEVPMVEIPLLPTRNLAGEPLAELARFLEELP